MTSLQWQGLSCSHQACYKQKISQDARRRSSSVSIRTTSEILKHYHDCMLFQRNKGKRPLWGFSENRKLSRSGAFIGSKSLCKSSTSATGPSPINSSSDLAISVTQCVFALDDRPCLFRLMVFRYPKTNRDTKFNINNIRLFTSHRSYALFGTRLSQAPRLGESWQNKYFIETGKSEETF